MTKTKRRLGIFLAVLVLIGMAGYFGFGYAVGRVLETKGLRKLLAGKTAKVLDCDSGYLRLASHGLSVSSRGFLARASPPHALTEMRASRLRASCNLAELWRAKWKIDNLQVGHLQAAYGEAAARHIERDEFIAPELQPPSKTESPLELDIRLLDVAHLDLFWGTKAEAEGAFKGVHAQFFPRDHNLVIHGDGGTFHQTKWPVAQLRQFKLFYAKPALRIDEGLLSIGGEGSISVTGNVRFEQQQSFDVQVTCAKCPVAPFLGSDTKDAKMEGEFDATARVQKDGSQQSPRAVGAIKVTKAILKNIEGLRNVAKFTGREELARLPIQQIKADYEIQGPALTVKNFLLESNELVIVEGEFTMKDQKIDGEFQLGVAPDLVDKFPGAREEVFKRSARGYLWTELALSGPTDHLRDNLKPRLLRAAQNHFAKGLLAPIFKPGQTVIQAIEAL